MRAALNRRPTRHPQAELGSVGWSASRDLACDEWLRQGSRLGVAGRNSSWWIGDWLRYGTARYGTKYSAAVRITGCDRQTLMNMVYVATRFEISRRRENLSWSHHGELASLEIDDQECWLDHAAAERLSVRDLRDELSTIHRAEGRRGRPRGSKSNGTRTPAALRGTGHGGHAASSSRTGSISARMVVCPKCGHEFSP